MDDSTDTSSLDLKALLQNLSPELGDIIAFCLLPKATDFCTVPMPKAMFCEEEGTTVLYSLAAAASLGYEVKWIGQQITLQVHSSLNAVGLLATVSAALAEQGIAANVFSPIFHDHIFVSPEHADEALQTLKRLSSSA